MPSVTQQKEHIEDITTAQFITGALRDISAIEMRAYRAQFENNKQFYQDIRSLYQLIHRIARKEGKGLLETRRTADTLYVAYTTNRHFYGSLNSDVIRALKKNTDTSDRCMIIGDTGKQLWQSKANKRLEMQYISFAGDMPNEIETRDFLQKVAKYNQVYVLYPGFISAFTQNAQMLDITFSSVPEEKNSAVVEETQYILEPEIMEMFDFFDTQVRYVLFERLLLETQLSRVAARLLKMDMADQNAEKMLVSERRELRRLRASFANMRMLETISGFIQWHKKK